jgi:hypothetical protein
LSYVNKARNQTIEDDSNDNARDCEGEERTYGVNVLELLEVYNQADSGDTQQVKQVDGDRNTDDVCN